MKKLLRKAVLVSVGFSFPVFFLLAGLTPPAAAQEGAAMYAIDPEPMNPSQCGQCHTHQFMALRNFGGGHQFECQNCHQVIHAYNPLRNNYAEIMPQCDMCHSYPHGEKQVQCLNCHSNPHAPLQVPGTAKVQGLCSDCHAAEAEQLITFPSAHTQQDCSACHHLEHGYIPTCNECHGPHFPGQEFSGCSECHPPHKPLEIGFESSTNAQICSGCHQGVYGKWKETISKHGKVNCTECHLSHGAIPGCLDCHEPPHPEQQLKMFPRCLDCHLDVHDLPVKN